MFCNLTMTSLTLHYSSYEITSMVQGRDTGGFIIGKDVPYFSSFVTEEELMVIFLLIVLNYNHEDYSNVFSLFNVQARDSIMVKRVGEIQNTGTMPGTQESMTTDASKQHKQT